MEKESNISLGGTIILLALFAQSYIFGQKYILIRSSDLVSHLVKALKYKKTLLYKKGIKQNQNDKRSDVWMYKSYIGMIIHRSGAEFRSPPMYAHSDI